MPPRLVPVFAPQGYYILAYFSPNVKVEGVENSAPSPQKPFALRRWAISDLFLPLDTAPKVRYN
jgi:hypothetical protein